MYYHMRMLKNVIAAVVIVSVYTYIVTYSAYLDCLLFANCLYMHEAGSVEYQDVQVGSKLIYLHE